MFKFIQALLLATLISQAPAALAQAQQPKQPDAAAIQRAQEAARTAAQTGGRAGMRVDEQGQLVRDEKGRATAEPMSTKTLQQGGSYLGAAMGVGGVSGVAQPARGQGAGAQASVEGSVDINCLMTPGQQKGLRGARVIFRGCAGESGAMTMDVEVCVAPMFGASLCSPQTFTALSLQEGAYVPGPQGTQFGLGCNTKRICAVSVLASASVSGTAESLAQQGQEARSKGAQSEESLQYGVSKTYGSDRFAQARQDVQSVDVVKVLEGARQTGQNCTATGRCLQEIVAEQTFTKSCDRSFDLTERTRRQVLPDGARLTCIEDHEGQDGKGIGTLRASSCVTGPEGGPVEDSRTGFTLIGRKELERCYEYTESNICDTVKVEAYYADLSKYAVTQTSYAPLALSSKHPVCDERPQSQSMVCASPEGWFGRTLSAAECSIQATVGGTPVSSSQDFLQKAGCGICADKQTGSVCYGEPPAGEAQDGCSLEELQGCTFVSSEPISFTDTGGLVLTQRDTYRCTKQSSQCARKEALNDQGQPCEITDPDLQANTFGLENIAKSSTDTSAFVQASVAIAMADEMAAGSMDAGATNLQMVPLLFGGKDLRCKAPTSSLLGVGGLLSRNCCRTDLTRPKKGALIQNGCDEEDVELSNARKQQYTHYVGDHCSSKGLFGKCLVREQTHCSFAGMLPRLVAEQGREQLAQLLSGSNGSQVERAALNFSFYDSTDQGSWAPTQAVNGVKLAGWRWPAFCADPQKTAQRQQQDPNAPQCPGMLSVWIASCDAPDCGALPAGPEAAGQGGWAVTAVDPLTKLTTAVSRYATVAGACSTANGQCAYEVAAWPAGSGGKVVITQDVRFPLWDASEGPATSGAIGVKSTVVMGQQQNISDIFYRPYSYASAPQRTLPATVRIDFSTDGGTASWTSVEVPTQIQGEFPVPGAGDLKLRGGCDARMNICSYRLVGTAVIELKTWGTPREPDCSGFTAGQIAALDFSKMDLSAWMEQVAAKNSTTDVSRAATRMAEALRGGSVGEPVAGNGQLVQPSASPSPYAVATPAEGWGPFEVTLAAGGYWTHQEGPRRGQRDKVTQVLIDWGDCTPQEPLPVVTSVNGQAAHGFRATHEYRAPNDSFHAQCGVSAEANVSHKVKLSVLTDRNDRFTVNLSVNNVWSTYQGNRANIATPPPPGTPGPPTKP